MKKRTLSLFLALVMALSLLAGCGSNANSPTGPDAATPSVSAGTDKPNGSNNGKDSDDDLLYIAPSEPDTPPNLPAPPIFPDLPHEVHDMNTASLVADYQSGTWSGGHSLWSEDDSTFVGVYAGGFLSYNCQGVIVYSSEALDLAKRVAAGENPLPLEDGWKGEKTYIDLPEQKLPEGALTSEYVVGEGTFVLMIDKVELYRQEELVDTWEIQIEETSLLATRPNSHCGENYVLTDDQLWQLIEGGTTELVYDHVVDAGKCTLPFLVALTLEDGILTERSNNMTGGWHDQVLAEGVADARMALGGIIYQTNSGEAFVATTLMAYYYAPGSNVHSLGQRTLDEVEALWEEFSEPLDLMMRYDEQLARFLESYGAPELNENILA